ncbi:MAG: RNA-binding protein [Planctomycetes bacterium]|nr:RNA-binding protein [Planctomycetota bacterium]
MGKRLYVGNLPYDADEASLREAFEQDGRVVESVHIVLDRDTQRPRGFAFVELATEEQARQAIEALNGTMLGTRQLRVTEAEDRRPSGPGAARSSGGAPAAGGGSARADAPRGNRFGPDARPRHERAPERRPQRRRGEGEEEDFGGRRGHRRFDDDEE